MSNERGRAKQDIERALTNLKHAADRLSPLVEQYADYGEWSEICGESVKIIVNTTTVVESLLSNVP